MITKEMKDFFEGYFFVEEGPEAAAAKLAEIIEERRRTSEIGIYEGN